jgi:hypothetical protein
METRSFIANFENLIGRIYSYFGRSTIRQRKLKEWHNFLAMPEIKFKRVFEIRWSSIRDCLKPIMINVKPGNILSYHPGAHLQTRGMFHRIILGSQALLAILAHTLKDSDVTKNERDAASELLMEILDDQFLFILHFHSDLHECILGECRLASSSSATSHSLTITLFSR